MGYFDRKKQLYDGKDGQDMLIYLVLQKQLEGLEEYFKEKGQEDKNSLIKNTFLSWECNIFHVACYLGDHALVRFLCTQTSLEILEICLKKPMKYFDFTPLHMASLFDHSVALKELLQCRLTEEVLTATDYQSYSYFHIACSEMCTDTIDVVLEFYAKHKPHYTKLTGTDDVVDDIVDNLSLKFLKTVGETPDIILNKILKHLDLLEAIRFLQETTIIHIACEFELFKPLKTILKWDRLEKEHLLNILGALDYVGDTALHKACRQKKDDAFLLLLESLKPGTESDCFDLITNKKNDQGQTVLHVACENNSQYAIKWITEKYKRHSEGRKLLSLQDCNGNTPIHLAISLLLDSKEESDNVQSKLLIMAEKLIAHFEKLNCQMSKDGSLTTSTGGDSLTVTENVDYRTIKLLELLLQLNLGKSHHYKTVLSTKNDQEQQHSIWHVSTV